MGKTFRKEKTISKQRQRLNNKRGQGRFHFEEYEYDSRADDKINGVKRDNNAEEIHPSEELHKQRPPEPTDQTDHG